MKKIITLFLLVLLNTGFALEVYEITPLDVGHILLPNQNAQGVYTLSPQGALTLSGNLQHLGSATPAEFEITGRPGELLKVQIQNNSIPETNAKNITVSNYTSSLQNWQCTINETGKCDFYVGVTFPVNQTNQGQINTQSIQINITDIMLYSNS